MDSVNKTLYIPLYAKALVSRRGLFLHDSMAESISRDEYRIVSVDQIRENNAVVRSLVDQIVSAGRWPDAFTY